MTSIKIQGVISTTKLPKEWKQEFQAWLASRGEYFGGSIQSADDKQVSIQIRPGDRVRHCQHASWGEGTVEELSLTGKSAYVKWDDGRWHGIVKIHRLVRLDKEI